MEEMLRMICPRVTLSIAAGAPSEPSSISMRVNSRSFSQRSSAVKNDAMHSSYSSERRMKLWKSSNVMSYGTS